MMHRTDKQHLGWADRSGGRCEWMQRFRAVGKLGPLKERRKRAGVQQYVSQHKDADGVAEWQ
jgi:hypothetical protein